jgi:acyl-CoA synthetase (AMP-forming)/AMP-acid ligase II
MMEQVATRIQARTLVEVLQARAALHPEKRCSVFLEDGLEVDVYTYADLDRKARAVAAALLRYSSPGESALLLLPPGLSFMAAFFGCLYAGVTAVPTYPPTGVRSNARIEAVVRDAGAVAVITTADMRDRLQRRLSGDSPLHQLTWLTIEAIDAQAPEAVKVSPPDPDGIAFLQFTSGSTSAPKGVMISHANLMANLDLMFLYVPLPASSTNVCWLPVYHDMGLIGHVLYSVFCGTTLAMMSPTAFLQRPFLWLQAMSRYKSVASGGPNFAYDLCLRKISAEERTTLDLSHWRRALNGAEPVRYGTVRRFVETFAPHGFREDALWPCYGLAEATLFVSAAPAVPPEAFVRVSAPALGEHRLELVPDGAADARMLVSSGVARGDQQVLIVDPDRLTPLPDGAVGEIWVQAPGVGQGYWNQPEATERTFRAHLASGEGPFMRTGDLGSFRDGQLFVTGRQKDMMIIRGRNLYPQDVERTLEDSHPAIEPSCVAAFSMEVEGEERLVAAAEVNRRFRLHRAIQ